jgi:hypothetical protein
MDDVRTATAKTLGRTGPSFEGTAGADSQSHQTHDGFPIDWVELWPEASNPPDTHGSGRLTAPHIPPSGLPS